LSVFAESKHIPKNGGIDVIMTSKKTYTSAWVGATEQGLHLPGADYILTNQYLWDFCSPNLPAAKRNGASENATSCKTFTVLIFLPLPRVNYEPL